MPGQSLEDYLAQAQSQYVQGTGSNYKPQDMPWWAWADPLGTKLLGLWGTKGISGDRVAYSDLGKRSAAVTSEFGAGPQKLGLAQLYQNFQNQGRLDPSVMARMQAQSAAATQNQMATTPASGNSSFSTALQQAIASAGANRGAQLGYQDTADSYKRLLGNYGALKGLVVDPAKDYAAIAAGQYRADLANRQASTAALTSGLGAALSGLLSKNKNSTSSDNG